LRITWPERVPLVAIESQRDPSTCVTCSPHALVNKACGFDGQRSRGPRRSRETALSVWDNRHCPRKEDVSCQSIGLKEPRCG
jgi:hypothetical protein